MSNQSWPGVSSLVLNEPLLWEKGRPGRVGVSLPESDVPAAPYEAEGMVRTDLNLPDLAELDVVRHYTRLSTWNFGVDTGMYPLGSCTMKYNPRTDEDVAALPGFPGVQPRQSETTSRCPVLPVRIRCSPPNIRRARCGCCTKPSRCCAP